jgi:hypothetical protein
MVEIAALIIAVIAVVGYARARGGRPITWGMMAAGGYVVILFVSRWILFPSQDDGNNYSGILLGWVWIVAILLFVRFGLGWRKLKPGAKWVCPKCTFLNSELAVVCEMCNEPYTEPQQ